MIAEKIEALAWGPNLPDGRHLLYVASDNDLFPDCRRSSTRLRSTGPPRLQVHSRNLPVPCRNTTSLSA